MFYFSRFSWCWSEISGSIGIISPKIKMHATHIFGFLMPLSTQRKQRFLEKWLIPDLRQGKCKWYKKIKFFSGLVVLPNYEKIGLL